MNIGTVTMTLKAIDETSGVIGDIHGSMSGLSGIATTLGQNLGAIGGILGDLGGPFKGVGDIISGFAAGGPAGAGIAMIGQGIDFLKQSVQAAGDSERVMTALKTAVENQGAAWGTVKDGIEGTLKSMQSTSRFSDEELAEALKTLVTHGMDTKDAMVALQTAMDTAVGSGKPLNEIANAIGKAFEGQDSALTRLVPAIGDMSKSMGEGATDADKFQGALKILGDRYGGQALTDAQTFAGTQERMANAWDDFQETIGKAVIPALTDLLNGLMKIGTEAVGPLMDSLGELWSALFGDDVNLKDFGKFVMDNIIVVLKETARFIREDVVPTIKMFHEAFQTASDIIGPPLKAMAEAIGGFLKTLHGSFQGFYDWLVGGSLWTDMWNQMSTIAGQLIGQLISDLGSKLFDPMTKAFTGAMQAVEDLWSKGWDAVQTGFTTYVDNFIPNLTAWGETLKTSVTSFTDSVKTTWDTSWQAVQTTFDTITSQIQTDLNTRFDEMKTFVTANLGEYAPTANIALSAMQSAMNAVMDLMHGDWHGFLTNMNQALSSFWSAVQTTTDYAFTILRDSFTNSMNMIKDTLSAATAAMRGVWEGFVAIISQGIEGFKGAVSEASDWLSSTLEGMQSTATSILDSISASFWSTVNSLISAAQTLWQSLVGGSIWTDMLDEMQAQTTSALGNIVGDFKDMSLAIPAATVPYSSVQPMTSQRSRSEEVSPLATMSRPMEITTTIPVTIDGELLYKIVNKKLVEHSMSRRY